ncbi:hypothetical protein BGX27_004318 [Mortierella sp. AM989]|nr:hypothetical protein BGX27_004318 [Mortierella sp. AM989]
MKINTILSLSAVFLASVATAVMDNDPNKIDTCIMPGVVAYTFDDGPGIYNDKLLAILKAKNVRATFFMVGQVVGQTPGQSASLKKILDAGHQLASHTYTHSNLDAMSEDAMKSEISRTSDVMFQYSGIRPAYMRAPEGRCGPACTKVMTELGLVISHWNMDTNDWRHKGETALVATNKSMEEIVTKFSKADRNTDSFILLQHEIHQFSVDYLADRVIDEVIKKGFRFVTMEECVGKPAYLPGSVVPPVVPSATPSGAPSGAPSGVVPAPSGSGVPSNGAVPSGSSSAGPNSTNSPIKDKSGAGFLQASAWAMGMAVAVAYALI